MPRFLPWLVLLFPALELWVLIQVGKEIGALATVGLVICSIFIGLWLLRLRGLHIARTMQAELAAGRMPSGQIIDTFCLMIAGCLFIFPGFVSDALAVLLIIPGFRHILLSFAAAKLRAQGFQSQAVRFESSSGAEGPVTWTCTTYGSAPPLHGEREPERRGNAVVIDCEPEVITSDEDTPDDSRPGDPGPNTPKRPGSDG